jgi:hypothetical protein
MRGECRVAHLRPRGPPGPHRTIHTAARYAPVRRILAASASLIDTPGNVQHQPAPDDQSNQPMALGRPAD